MAKGIKFFCPDCQEQISAECAILSEDKRILLVAPCSTCGVDFHFDIEKLIVELLSAKSPRVN